MPHFMTKDATAISYRLVGQGEPLICLPGGPGRSSEYLEDLGGLAHHRLLVLLDPRGTGESQMPDDPFTLAFPRLATDLEELREHLGLHRIDILAHAAGAVVAEVYTACFARRVGNLVLVSPSARLHGVTPDSSQLRASRLAEPWFVDASDAYERAFGATPPRDVDEMWSLINRSVPFFYGRWDARAWRHASKAREQMSTGAQVGFAGGPLASHFDSAAAVELLGELDTPTLVVAGELDGGGGVGGAQVVAAAFPNARLAVMPSCGHYPWVDEPAQFVDTVLRGLL